VWITSAVIGESVRIGECTFIGLNATVAPFVQVGSHNLIGAAALIAQDTKDHEVYRGPRSRASQVSSLRLRNLQIIR
jgi:acetyltransferase-like isoleucine patch superfamily enzyme